MKKVRGSDSNKVDYIQKNKQEQLNPNNNKYWRSRGYKERPENWADQIKEAE
jgi:hypothetical protein